MVSKDITIGVALVRIERSRVFTRVVQKANEFRSSISIVESSRRVNAKSLLGVMALELTDGMTVTLIADGPDEEAAVNELAAMLV